MRGMSAALLGVLVGLAAALLLNAFAQAPSAPGAGKGFLIDKHLAAKLTCAACHGENPPRAAPPMATCLGCHGGTYEKLAATTAADRPNPHSSHQGPVPCTNCHHVHKASETFCNSCHSYDMNTP